MLDAVSGAGARATRAGGQANERAPRRGTRAEQGDSAISSRRSLPAGAPAMDSRRRSSSSASPSPPRASSCPSPSPERPLRVIKVEPLPTASPPLPSSASSSASSAATAPPGPEVVARRCAWCSALHTEQTAAIVTDDQLFCNELCFAQSRRARFKRCKGGRADDGGSPGRPQGPGAARGPGQTSCSSAEHTPSQSASPRAADRPALLAPPAFRAARHRLVPGPGLARPRAPPGPPPCCGHAVDALFPAPAAAAATVFVPVPLPIPIPIFKSAPELLEIMRRYNFRPGTPPQGPGAPSAPVLCAPGPPLRAASAEDCCPGSSDEASDDQALDLSLPKGIDADLRHLTEASFYKARRQLILDKPYTKATPGAHFHRRSFKAMRRK